MIFKKINAFLHNKNIHDDILKEMGISYDSMDSGVHEESEPCFQKSPAKQCSVKYLVERYGVFSLTDS